MTAWAFWKAFSNMSSPTPNLLYQCKYARFVNFWAAFSWTSRRYSTHLLRFRAAVSEVGAVRLLGLLAVELVGSVSAFVECQKSRANGFQSTGLRHLRITFVSCHRVSRLLHWFWPRDIINELIVDLKNENDFFWFEEKFWQLVQTCIKVVHFWKNLTFLKNPKNIFFRFF